MTTYADGPSPEVAQFAAGIESASGGTILPGLGWGITSKLGTQMLDYELSHRYGTGLDLDCVGADTDAVFIWVTSLDCVEEVVQFGGSVHVTLRPGANVDLSGCPKPKKKKAAEEPAPE
jgi:hypothetical protein